MAPSVLMAELPHLLPVTEEEVAGGRGIMSVWGAGAISSPFPRLRMPRPLGKGELVSLFSGGLQASTAAENRGSEPG